MRGIISVGPATPGAVRRLRRGWTSQFEVRGPAGPLAQRLRFAGAFALNVAGWSLRDWFSRRSCHRPARLFETHLHRLTMWMDGLARNLRWGFPAEVRGPRRSRKRGWLGLVVRRGSCPCEPGSIPGPAPKPRKRGR